jgi:hypothetical protein
MTLAAVIEWKWGLVADCDLDAGTITRWDDAKAGRAQPDQAEIDTATTEYNAFVASGGLVELNPLQFDAFLDELGTTEAAAIAASDLIYDTVPARKRAKRYIRKSPVYNRDDARINKIFSDQDPDGLGFTVAQINDAWLAVKDENGV